MTIEDCREQALRGRAFWFSRLVLLPNFVPPFEACPGGTEGKQRRGTDGSQTWTEQRTCRPQQGHVRTNKHRGREGSPVGRASDRHAADKGSIPRCGKGVFSQGQLSVQTLLRCQYTPVCNRMH